MGPSLLDARPKGVAAQRRVWESQEGAREPYGALAPFCPSPWARRTPAGEHRLSRAAEGGHCARSPRAYSRLQRRAAVSAEGLPSSDGKAKGTPALGRAYPILLTARCTACSARFAACCAECRSDGFSIALAATMLITAPAIAPVATPDTNGDTCILLPPFFAFFQRRSPRRSLIMSRRARFLPPSALTKSTCKIRNILRNRLFTKTLAYSIMIENTVAPFTVRFGKIRL